jgi:hypothetical protein
MPPVNQTALTEAIDDLADMVRHGRELTPTLIAAIADDYAIQAALLDRKFNERYPHGVGVELPTVPEPREREPQLKPSKLALAVGRALVEQGEKVDDERLADITLKLRSDPHLLRSAKRSPQVRAKLAEIDREEVRAKLSEIDLEEAKRRVARMEGRLERKT